MALAKFLEPVLDLVDNRWEFSRTFLLSALPALQAALTEGNQRNLDPQLMTAEEYAHVGKDDRWKLEQWANLFAALWEGAAVSGLQSPAYAAVIKESARVG